MPSDCREQFCIGRQTISKISHFFLYLLFTVLLCATLAGATSHANAAATKLTLIFARPMNHKVTQGLSRVYTEAFKRLDIELEFVDLPQKRASRWLNTGQVDGELSRAYDYGTIFPNIVRVEEPINHIKFLAFTIDPNISIEGWRSLKNTNFKIVCRNGVKKCGEMLPKVTNPENYFMTNSLVSALKMLIHGRVHIMVEVDLFYKRFSKSEEFLKIRDGKTIHQAGVLEATSAHAWLHKKHSALAPKLAEVLREMKQEGLFQKLIQKSNKNLN